jgi:hypothetical protein
LLLARPAEPFLPLKPVDLADKEENGKGNYQKPGLVHRPGPFARVALFLRRNWMLGIPVVVFVVMASGVVHNRKSSQKKKKDVPITQKHPYKTLLVPCYNFSGAQRFLSLPAVRPQFLHTKLGFLTSFLYSSRLVLR